MAIANQIYRDSQVNLEMRIPANGIRELSGYSQAGRSSGTILGDAKDGRIPNLHAWRREVRALGWRRADRAAARAALAASRRTFSEAAPHSLLQPRKMTCRRRHAEPQTPNP